MRKPLETLLLPSSAVIGEQSTYTYSWIRERRESIIMQVDCGAVSHFTLNHSISNVGIHLNTPYCLPLAGHYCCFISHIHTYVYKRCIRHTPWCVVSLDFLLLHSLREMAGAKSAPAHNVLARERRDFYMCLWSGDALLNVIIEWPPRKDTVAASEIYSPVPILYSVGRVV
jgi:hypothetical protein